MKKFLIIFSIIAFIIPGAWACEICGCGVGNSYIGILPEFNKNIFGFRYRYNSMLTHIGVGGATTYLTTAESYRTLEAWGGVNITRNFRLMASVPYSFDERSNQGITLTKSGLGDISVSAFYQVIHSRKSFSDKLLVQSLWIGGGLKLPTGNYNPVSKATSVESANLFQLGTGSTDFITTAMYDIRLQDAGFNLTSSYRINTVNQYQYQYGNKFSFSAQAYYKFKIEKGFSLSPNAGVLTEMGQKDTDHSIPVDISGGNLLMGSAGVELAFRKFAIGGNWQTPLTQNLANGIIKANNRFMIHFSFVI
jgi:hypothetical protein